MSKKERIVCGLDIGTTKICMMIARSREDGDIEVLSTGYANSGGLRKGIVIDLEEAAASIRKAAEEAEAKAGISVDWVTVGVSGSHIQSYNCHGAIQIEGKHHEVSAQDMHQVIKAAQSIPIPPEREIIHVIPQEFLLDNRGEIQNPLGLTGSRLDVNIHVVTCESALNQNLINAVNRAQMRVSKIVLQQLASAESVLSGDEKELGVAIVDIGGGTTDIALFANKAIRFSGVLPVGGAHFTRDLAVGLRTPIEDAERIKRESGTVLPASLAGDEMVEVPGVGMREPRILPRKMACEILADRAAELLELIKEQLARSGNGQQLIAGVVLTGGGSMLNGMLELAEQVFDLPVRQGLPRAFPGLTEELSHPVYATALGLAILGAQSGIENGSQSWRPSSPWMLSRLLSWISSS